MATRPLISQEQVVGVFRGFSEGGMEFHADLALPYRADYHQIPLHGQFLLIQLDGPDEAVLGRITSLRSEGRLVSSEGEDYLVRQARDGQSPPEDIREQYLKYRVNVRVLGVLRRTGPDRFTFVPSHRRIPHVGSPVVFPSPDVLREIAGHRGEGAPLGFLAMGEFIWAAPDYGGTPDGAARALPTGAHPASGQAERAGADGAPLEPLLRHPEPWMRLLAPPVLVRFPVEHLIARRTFVFARAGFGKSNLVKLLFSELYRETPTILRRGGRQVPVGTLIFDRDGEYFWPDHHGRPGLCDVPHLQERLVVFTSRKGPSSFYQSFVAGPVKLDIRRLPAATVVGIALSPDRQDQQNVRKLKGLPLAKWRELVDLIHREGNNADLETVKRLLSLDSGGDVEAVAARSNVNTIVRMLHDPHSRLLDYLSWALGAGRLCVVDLSLLSGEVALVLSGLILQQLFDYNQERFTTAEANTIPVIAVLEEAQSVLGHGANAGQSPYVTWVKEGRKYDLGAVMITQQPGSIPDELLSQGDNWFLFHLLSASDLKATQRANAHFSEDLLSSLLNEPIKGHCLFWSSVGGKPYPLPVRIFSFEERYRALDPDYTGAPVSTYVHELQRKGAGPSHPGDSWAAEEPAPAAAPRSPETAGLPPADEGRAPASTGQAHSRPVAAAAPGAGPSEGNFLDAAIEEALRSAARDTVWRARVEQYGLVGFYWRTTISVLEQYLPDIPDRNKVANSLVPKLLNQCFGEKRWTTALNDRGWRVIKVQPEALKAFLDRQEQPF